MIDTSKVRKITRDEILEIYEKTTFSNHAKERMLERGAALQDVIASPLAYGNTDGTINIQSRLKEQEYFVFAPVDDGYLMITYKENSHNGVSLQRKYELALKGYERK